MVHFAPCTQPPSIQQPSLLPLIYWFGWVWGAHKIGSIQGSGFPAWPLAQSICHSGQCHLRNQKRSSISIDFFSSFNCYLLWESMPNWQYSPAKKMLALLFCMSRAVHDIPQMTRWELMRAWMNEMRYLRLPHYGWCSSWPRVFLDMIHTNRWTGSLT